MRFYILDVFSSCLIRDQKYEYAKNNVNQSVQMYVFFLDLISTTKIKADFYTPYLVKIKPDVKDVAICVWSQNNQNFLFFLHKCFGHNLDGFFHTVDQYFMWWPGKLMKCNIQNKRRIFINITKNKNFRQRN